MKDSQRSPKYYSICLNISMPREWLCILDIFNLIHSEVCHAINMILSAWKSDTKFWASDFELGCYTWKISKTPTLAFKKCGRHNYIPVRLIHWRVQYVDMWNSYCFFPGPTTFHQDCSRLHQTVADLRKCHSTMENYSYV